VKKTELLKILTIKRISLFGNEKIVDEKFVAGATTQVIENGAQEASDTESRSNRWK